MNDTTSFDHAYPASLRTASQALPYAPLDHLGVLRVNGNDAPSFLQGQLSNDVLTIPPGHARLAGYLTPNGRMLATFWVLRQDVPPAPEQPQEPVFWLICARDIASAIAKRLSMYVLRAKCRVRDASDSHRILGFVGPSTRATRALATQQDEVVVAALPEVQLTETTTDLLTTPAKQLLGAGRQLVRSLLIVPLPQQDTEGDATAAPTPATTPAASGAASTAAASTETASTETASTATPATSSPDAPDASATAGSTPDASAATPAAQETAAQHADASAATADEAAADAQQAAGDRAPAERGSTETDEETAAGTADGHDAQGSQAAEAGAAGTAGAAEAAKTAAETPETAGDDATTAAGDSPAGADVACGTSAGARPAFAPAAAITPAAGTSPATITQDSASDADAPHFRYSEADWLQLDVASGIPWISAATAENFVPQMLNLELAGGVSFKKGCYPGQEVVARSEYRGKVKRRMFAGMCSGPLPEPGTDVLAWDGTPIGQVICVARLSADTDDEALANGEGMLEPNSGELPIVLVGRRFLLLFEARLEAVGSQPRSAGMIATSLRIGNAAIGLLQLPYEIPEG